MQLNNVTLDLTSRLTRGEAESAMALAVANGPAARHTANRWSVSSTVRDLSHKMAEEFSFDSSGQGDAMAPADMLEDVAAFRPQPVEVRYHDGSKPRRAFPDLGLHMVGGTLELLEVKLERSDPALVSRLRALRAGLREHGITYRVRTRLWQNRQPHLATAAGLRRHASWPLGAWREGPDHRLIESLHPGRLHPLRGQPGQGDGHGGHRQEPGVTAVHEERRARERLSGPPDRG